MVKGHPLYKRDENKPRIRKSKCIFYLSNMQKSLQDYDLRALAILFINTSPDGTDVHYIAKTVFKPAWVCATIERGTWFSDPSTCSVFLILVLLGKWLCSESDE